MEKKTDLRIIKTHKALCDTFLIMLGEKKFEDITVNELCERAMVRRATFYKHFADKYEFFGFFVRQMQERFAEENKRYNADTSPHSYHVFLFRRCISFFKEHEQLTNSVIHSNLFPTLLDIFSEEIYQHVLLKMKEDKKNGTSFPACIEILASFYTGGIVHTFRYWLTMQEQIPEDELVDEFEKILSSFS